MLGTDALDRPRAYGSCTARPTGLTYGTGLFLVRPDGYVGWTGTPRTGSARIWPGSGRADGTSAHAGPRTPYALAVDSFAAKPRNRAPAAEVAPADSLRRRRKAAASRVPLKISALR